ncbi:hypothetical protein FALBO_6352 [Fusarium albosuccineum]|uniref:Uncharacterized protein n=1 Tax=Fusarium albosuccineum TaxID=1237068 RepID=A0A8H4LEP6_9HYPO|nr:hypothetical protein FALBO_6352 [Fusarium albosuccineum]
MTSKNGFRTIQIIATRLRWSAWGPEVWASLSSVASFIAIVALLSHFHGKPVFTWNGVTLNALVSVLSVAMKASLAYVTAECMAQWKWILFTREPRLLIDFDRIDAATRGPLGSLRVLLRTRGALAVQFGALLSLLAVALDPLAQQLVQLRNSVVFEPSSTKDGGLVALNSRAPSYDMGSFHRKSFEYLNKSTSVTMGWSAVAELHPSMQAAILRGLSRSPWEVEREAVAQCPTGNCIWEQFNTLGVCYKCNNISSHLKRVDLTDAFKTVFDGEDESVVPAITAYTLPNGHFMPNFDACPEHSGVCRGFKSNSTAAETEISMTSFGTGNRHKTNTMKDIDTLIWSMSLIFPSVEALAKSSSTSETNGDTNKKLYWPEYPMQAMECSLYYCIKTISAAIEGNELVEKAAESSGMSRDPNSWQRSKTRLWSGNNISANGVFDDMEFHVNYSAAIYSDLVLKVPDNGFGTTSSFNISQSSITSISHFMQDLFTRDLTTPRMKEEEEALRKVTQSKLGKDAVGFNGYSVISAELRDEWYPHALAGLWTVTRNNVSSSFSALATSMTNEMRRNHNRTLEFRWGQETDQFRDERMNVRGRVGTPTVLYDIRWSWILLHGLILGSVISFLLITLERAARAAYVKIPQGGDDEEAVVRIREDRETANDDSDQWSSAHTTAMELETRA